MKPEIVIRRMTAADLDRVLDHRSRSSGGAALAAVGLVERHQFAI